MQIKGTKGKEVCNINIVRGNGKWEMGNVERGCLGREVQLCPVNPNPD